jgi:hypothetical protein
MITKEEERDESTLLLELILMVEYMHLNVSQLLQSPNEFLHRHI